ncbi:tyrosine-type recombinase/integrase [Rhodomicrobium lacus]|uniref:tyrosine-type recombinase/integrase n=1 Tax=Rhodomicrobium lacus TaxID=2498452 RepID=UPI000F8C561F|nr:site-specific integrase [Rhodomicrobium lacus]
MPRKQKSARLYLRQRGGREPVWVILDRGREIGTGCGVGDTAGAEAALQKYLSQKYRPSGTSDPAEVGIADILNFYMQEMAGSVARPDVITYRSAHLLRWWATKKAIEIKPKACRDYVKWRCSLVGPRGGTVAESTARKDLETLRAALNFYHAEYTLTALPVVSMPGRGRRREDWLTRSEAARLLWAAWRGSSSKFAADADASKHLARVILIGLYSGTRSGALLRLRWLPSPDAGWIDVERGLIYRKGGAQSVTNKRQPPAPIHARLIPHLRRWQARDLAAGIVHVIHYKGAPIEKLKTAWRRAREVAAIAREIVPHSLRHTAATWQMQAGTDRWEAAGYLGMSVDTLERHYGHHHPDFQSGAARAEAPKKRPQNVGGKGTPAQRKSN